MRSTRLAFAAVAVLLSVAAGSRPGFRSPTAAADFPDLYSFSTSLTNLTGAATIVDAQVILDNVVVVDSCPPADQSPELDGDLNIVGYDCSAPPAAAVALAGSGAIGPGGHQLVVLLSAISQQATLSAYQVSAFTITIRQQSGAALKTINLPSEAAVLGPGANGGPRTIVYTFSI